MKAIGRQSEPFLQSGSMKYQGAEFKVRGAAFKGDDRVSFFAQRVINAWKVLPMVVVVETDTMGTFKRL